MLERLRSLWRDRDGSALLEAAVLTPVLFVLVVGVYEFSWYFYRQHLISTGVRDAARYLARTNLDNPCSSAANQTIAKNIATMNSDGGARVAGWTASNVTIACTPVSSVVCGAETPCVLNSGPNAYDVYIVTVSTSYTPSTLGFGFPAPSIVVSHQERAVGQG